MGNCTKVKFNHFLILVSIIMLGMAIFPLEAKAAILEPSQMDKSVEYLAAIFGNKISKLFTNEYYAKNLFLGNLFEVFNNIILVVSIFILGYITILSTINTAQEGQVMGKKWSSVWIPLRSALGLLLLSPMPGYGYSSLQVAIMWIVLNGVGAADHIWNLVLNNLSQGIGISQKEILNKENLNIINSQSIELANQIFNSLACVKILNKNMPAQNNVMLEYYSEYLNPVFSAGNEYSLYNTIKFGVKNASQYPQQQNICGDIKISASLMDNELTNQHNEPIPITDNNKKKLLQNIYKIKFNSIKIMIDKIDKFVGVLINAAIKQDNGEVFLPQELEQPGLLYHIIKEYQQAIMYLNKQDVLAWLKLSINLDKQSISEQIIRQGRELGWITAGSYYYLLSQYPIKNLLATASQLPVINTPLLNQKNINYDTLTQSGLGVKYNAVKPYVTALNANEQYINHLFAQPKQLMVTDTIRKNINKVNYKQLNQLHDKLPDAFRQNVIANPQDLNEIRDNLTTKNPKIKPYVDSFFSLYETAIKEIEACFTTENDPLISQAMFGTKLMQTAETFWTGITVSSLVSESFAELFKESQNQSSIGFVITLLPITLIFSTVIWGIGATLAVYTPMIPYMIFIVTAIGWFMLVIEAILAAPIISLGFIAPSQDELGKVAPSLGIISNMFLKPTLMIFGLLIASKLYSTLINLINLGFKFTFATLQSQAGVSMFAWIVTIILYSGFILTLVNKCYGLIYQLPDKVLRWIGLNAEQSDLSAIKETQHMFDQGAKQSIAPVEGTATAAAKKFKIQAELAKNSQALAKHMNATNRDGSGLQH